ncbi:hypothetical protein IQ279_03280 [Streptomyces verrucosisporus]|uniref:hypothetical protein n=1 Tax=Streptomyces verrucosisporus TaxID=1695161 RepID=UPI0019CFB6DC|nr:hypothetical protein [Streptomyces verrucosisporus]MBN3928676.1 hypothetical protein [Streptomyces verrucosisporus]
MSPTQRYGDLELSFQPTYQGVPVGALLSYFQSSDDVPPELISTGQKLGPDGMQGAAGVLMLKDCSADQSLLRKPVRWIKVAQLPDFGPNSWGVWRPIPPEGYVALGDIVHLWDWPSDQIVGSAGMVACVKRGVHTDGRTYVRQGECGNLIYESSGGTRLWSVVAPPYPDGDLDEHLYLPVGNFTGVKTSGKPAPTESTWILDLPAVIEKHDGPKIPELTSHARPPAQTVITDRTVTVPYYMVRDDSRDEKWKVENSPFYKLRRKRHFELILFRDNQNGSQPQNESQAVTTGVTQESSSAFCESTGVTVGMEIGVSAGGKPFGIGVETTVTASMSTTVEMGYERRNSVSSMRQETKTRGLTIPPYSSACLWMEHHTLLPVRANGDTLGDQAALGFTTDYYVTGQYPNDADVQTWEEDDAGTRTLQPLQRLAEEQVLTV